MASKHEIKAGLKVKARYASMGKQTATVSKVEDILISRTALRPFKLHITLEFADGTTAGMDAGFLRCYWRPEGGGTFGKAVHS